MSKQLPQRINVKKCFNEYVKDFGGELVSELLSKTPIYNADYLFRNQSVVAELKCLEKDFFHDKKNHSKLKSMYDKWVHEGIIQPNGLGRIIINTKELPMKCQIEVANFAKEIVQRRIRKANKQIKLTKDHFGLPDAKGLLLLVNDGNYFLESNAIMYTLSRILKAKYTSINSVVYFTVNIVANMPGIDRNVLVWVDAAHRDTVDGVSRNFLDALREGWISFLKRKIGEDIPQIYIGDKYHQSSIEEIKFKHS
ncbi:MAG: hypothetical protein QQN41_10675 [Nitrosopumilus sp.]